MKGFIRDIHLAHSIFYLEHILNDLSRMDSGLKNFLDTKKNLVLDTKLPGVKKQKTQVVKPEKNMLEKPTESDPYRAFANSVVKDKPSKKDLIEKIEVFIQAEEAKL